MSASEKEVRSSSINPDLLLKIAIQAIISPVSPKYTYPEEQGINPAWQSIDEIESPLILHEKRIFVLRSDFILATGVKNAEQIHDYEGLKDTFHPSVYPFIDWDDRYGHPSLVIGAPDNRVYYAGFICQRETAIEVFLSSGRYNRSARSEEGIEPLTALQTEFVEAWLAIQFNRAYGIQPVIFYDTTPDEDDADSALFFRNIPFPESKVSRTYTSERIAAAIQLACVETNIGIAEQYIQKNITPVRKKYCYPNETSINPGYQDIAVARGPLRHCEKRIWALRSDFTLATGVKNAYEKEYGYTGFYESFSKSLHALIDWNDRYGHPSLTLAEGDYDGSAYYAGYICQRDGFLQVYLVSGRFERTDLNEKQTAILEAFIAAQFLAVFGLQDITFDYGDSDDPRYHTAFFGGGFKGRGSLEGNPQRYYNRQSIRTILETLSLTEEAQKVAHSFFDHHATQPESSASSYIKSSTPGLD